MNRRTLVFIAIGLAVAAGAVWLTLFMTEGSHLRLEGAIQKYRTVAVDEKSSIAFVDFRVNNPADYRFMVKKVTVTVTDAEGQKHEGENIAEMDAVRIFEYYTALGQKFNQTLISRQSIPAKTSWDRMMGVKFDLPEAKIQAPKQVAVRIDEVDGAHSEFVK